MEPGSRPTHPCYYNYPYHTWHCLHRISPLRGLLALIKTLTPYSHHLPCKVHLIKVTTCVLRNWLPFFCRLPLTSPLLLDFIPLSSTFSVIKELAKILL